MPLTTPKFDLPYPIDSETADVPRDIAALAAAVELALGGDIWHVVGDGTTGMGTTYGIVPIEDIPWTGDAAFTHRGGLTCLRGSTSPSVPTSSPPDPAVFVLPLQYRPAVTMTFGAVETADEDDTYTNKVSIHPDGRVTFFRDNIAAVLDGICFPAVLT